MFVNDLLKLAKIQEEDVILEKSNFSLIETINENIEQHRILTQQRNLQIKLESNGICTIEADRKKIHQVISNLISNAVKFASNGDIYIDLNQKNGAIFCSITDMGIGIPSRDLERIFDRFFHGKHSAKGSGIGLTIAKAWIEAHGGKIWAESEGEGKGTKVTFTLPVG